MLGPCSTCTIDTNIFWDLGEIAINGALLIQNSGTIQNEIIIKNLYTVMICWQKYLSLCKYSKLLHGYKFQNKLYLRRKNQQLHNSRQKPKLTLKYQEEEQSLLASDYSAWCCQDTAKTEISALSMTFPNSDAETVNFILFPFLS